MRKLILIGLMLFVCSAAFAELVEVGAPWDRDWQEIVANAETATTDAFDPWNSSGVLVPMTAKDPNRSFTGIQIRSKFTAVGRAQEPVIACFGKKGTDYALLSDMSGQTSITISPTDDSTIENNTNDDTSYWSTPSLKIDAMGAENVLCTVVTAATAGDGAVAIELSRY